MFEIQYSFLFYDYLIHFTIFYFKFQLHILLNSAEMRILLLAHSKRSSLNCLPNVIFFLYFDVQNFVSNYIVINC